MVTQTLRRTDASIATRILGIVLFAFATALSARLAAFFPNSPVPLTLQVLVVVLSGFTLGGRDALIAQGLYLQAILLGAPLTAAGLGGPIALVGPTAGYLISFPAAAWVAGSLSQRVSRGAWWGRALGGLAALAIIYGLGTLWLASFVGGLNRAFALGVAPFIGPDLAKVAIAAGLLSLRKN
ncbi:MAG: biotin transporter BioY [Anaerolineae bacterium]